MISYALNEALSVLDAISLTASGHSATAQATMSPALKQMVPIGAFRPKLTEPAELTTRAKKRLNDLSLVSKSQNFQTASEKFAGAFQRLQTQAQNQSKYWEEIASLRNAGWQVSRLPRDKKAIVVHIGAADASAQFQGRSVTPIQQDETGDVFITGHTDTRKPKMLYVQISRGSAVTGHFVFPQTQSDSSYKVHQDLLHARDALFMEELFTEASREARLVANNGVQARSSSITFNVLSDYVVKIEYTHNPSTLSGHDQSDDELAAAVGSVLRLMLVAEYQQRYLRRSEHPPPVMTQVISPSADSMVLRPVMTLLRHHNIISPVLKLLQSYKASLGSADVQMSYDIEHSGADTGDHSILRTLKQILTTKISIKLPTGTSLSATIETFLSPPRFGTQFSVQEHESSHGQRSLKHSPSLDAMKQVLSDAVSYDVSCFVVEHFHDEATFDNEEMYPVRLLPQEDEEPRLALAVRCKDGNLAMLGLREGKDTLLQAFWGVETTDDLKESRSLISTAESWAAETKAPVAVEST